MSTAPRAVRRAAHNHLGGYDARMRWFLALVVGVVVALSGAGAAWAAQDGAETVAPPRVLVLVERLTMDEALEATAG